MALALVHNLAQVCSTNQHKCGSRWESGMRISRTISEDGRTIWVCSCWNANIVRLPKGWECPCGCRMWPPLSSVPLVGSVCCLCNSSTGPLSRDLPSSRLWDHEALGSPYLLTGPAPSLADLTPNVSWKFIPIEWILMEIWCFKGLQMRFCGSSVNSPSACYFYCSTFTLPVNCSGL